MQYMSNSMLPTDDWVAVDYLVDGPRCPAAVRRGTSRLTGIAVADSSGYADVFQTDLAQNLAGLGDKHRIYHDAIFARVVEQQYNLPAATMFDDVRIASHLLNENESCEFGDLRQRWSVRKCSNASSCQPNPAQLIAQIVLDRDPFAQIEAQRFRYMYGIIEVGLVEPVSSMYRNGLPIDRQRLEQILAENSSRMVAARQQVNLLAGTTVNLNSYQALSAVLFERLSLPVVNRTANGNPSIDDTALQAIEHLHPIIQPIQQYRAAKRIVDSANALVSAAPADEACAVCVLDPQGTKTGRFSARDPNLQALPPELLDTIVAPPGELLVELDYSQMELRVLAERSEDKVMLEAFRNGLDIHNRTASRIFGVPEGSVSPDQRRIAKAVNFGLIFGQTPESLACDLSISVADAEAAINGFSRAYPQAGFWITQVKAFAGGQQCIHTQFGRYRRMSEAENNAPRRWLRQAVNAAIQGTAADVMKLAIARVWEFLPENCRLLFTVHDSLLLAIPEANADECVLELKSLVEFLPPKFRLPLAATVRTGRTWADCKRSSENRSAVMPSPACPV